MKHILFLAALAASSFSHAQTTFEARNSGGGSIVLTTRDGACDKGRLQAYAVGSSGKPLFGCWTAIDGRIWVEYTDKDIRAYDPEGFVEKNNNSAGKRKQSVPEKTTGM